MPCSKKRATRSPVCAYDIATGSGNRGRPTPTNPILEARTRAIADPAPAQYRRAEKPTPVTPPAGHRLTDRPPRAPLTGHCQQLRRSHRRRCNRRGGGNSLSALRGSTSGRPLMRRVCRNSVLSHCQARSLREVHDRSSANSVAAQNPSTAKLASTFTKASA